MASLSLLETNTSVHFFLWAGASADIHRLYVSLSPLRYCGETQRIRSPLFYLIQLSTSRGDDRLSSFSGSQIFPFVSAFRIRIVPSARLDSDTILLHLKQRATCNMWLLNKWDLVRKWCDSEIRTYKLLLNAIPYNQRSELEEQVIDVMVDSWTASPGHSSDEITESQKSSYLPPSQKATYVRPRKRSPNTREFDVPRVLQFQYAFLRPIHDSPCPRTLKFCCPQSK